MAISLILLKFSKAPYAYDEEVELFVKDRCAGCGAPYTWRKWAHLPWVGQRVVRTLADRHHKKCKLWRVLGTAVDYEAAAELVLFGREVAAPCEQELHVTNGFTILDKWPEQALVKMVFDWPTSPLQLS